MVILCLVGCHQQSKVQGIVDKTVDISSFDINDFPIVQHATVNLNFEKIYSNVKELYDGASYVVYGKVKEVSYYDESGGALTCYNFVIEESYKGELQENDEITILAVGGYVRLEKVIEVFGEERYKDIPQDERKKTIVEEDVMGAPLPKENDQYLVFLSDPIDNEPPFPDGVYSELGAFMGRYYEEGDTLTRYTPENEPDFYGQEDEHLSLSQMKDIFK